MKALLLAHPEGDFLEGGVYIGLHEILGQDGIVDYPYKKSYHGQMHTYESCYAHAPGTGTTGPFDWMPNLPAREWSFDEVLSTLREHEFDFIVMTPRPVAIREMRHILSNIGREHLPPIVLMCGEDYARFDYEIIDEFRPSVYLKRELLPEYHHNRGTTRVEPFPFCSPHPPREPAEKDIDVFFPCGATSGMRAEVVEALRGQYGERFVGGSGIRFGLADYLDALNRSKIAISVRGWGMDTLRFWEIPSFQTLMIADVLPLVRPHPFSHGTNVLYFTSVTELLEQVRCALEDEAWRERIAAAGNAHLRDYHSSRARAQQLIEHATRSA